MHFSPEVLQVARAKLAQQREDHASLAASRLAEVYRKVPEIQEIDKKMRLTMLKAAQSVFARDGAGEQLLAEAREENLDLRQRRQALLEASFPKDYLNEEPICPHCDGTGYVGSNMCQCLRELCVQEQRRVLEHTFGKDMCFGNFCLDYYPDTVSAKVPVSPRALMAKNLDICRRYAREFGPESGNLLLSGGTGLGKTHLAVAVGMAVGEQGYSVCYESAISLFSKLEKAKFTPSEDTVGQTRRLEECDLLIVDDLGTELPGQFVTASLYGLLEQRLRTGKAMVITTNLNVDEAGTRYSPQIASRLYGEFARLHFLGTDIRVLKNRGFYGQ